MNTNNFIINPQHPCNFEFTYLNIRNACPNNRTYKLKILEIRNLIRKIRN